MNTEQAELFFSILTVAALAGTALLLVAIIGARRVAGFGQLVDAVRTFAVPLAAVVAATCMGGSLYFSEVAGFLPCTLCWYQRIAMYSLAVILTIAAIRHDNAIRRYALPLAGIGAAISTYHCFSSGSPRSTPARARPPCRASSSGSSSSASSPCRSWPSPASPP